MKLNGLANLLIVVQSVVELHCFVNLLIVVEVVDGEIEWVCELPNDGTVINS